MILSINAGYYNTKINTGHELITIPSRIQSNVDAERSIMHDNKVYEVGAGHRSLDDKQENLCHKLMTEYAILKYGKKEIDLMVALPLTMYLNKPYRESYRFNLLGQHKGIVDGIPTSVEVANCTVYAEGASAYLSHKAEYACKVVGLLDFGGNTINCMVFDKGQLIKDTLSQLDLGMIKLERQLIDAINTHKLWNVQEYELQEIIQSNECADIVADVYSNYVSEVKQRLLEKQWNIDRLQLFATGGGAKQLKPYLEQHFKHIKVSDNGIYDNVIGLQLAGEVLYKGVE